MYRLILCFLICKSFSGIHGQNLEQLTCGRPYNLGNRITGGEEVAHGEFPWMAAIFFKSFSEPNSKFTYICGGSLVSENKIVTAAHCVHPKREDKAVKPYEMSILLGANGLENYQEPGRVNCAVKDVHVHAGWNPQSDRYTDDIAVLVLEENIQYSKYIRPICLSENLDDFLEGQIAGWGKNEFSKSFHEKIPTKIRNTIISKNEECYRRSSILSHIGWEESFCGGASNVKVCAGDSGSGLVVEVDEIFYLKGILSSSEANLTTFCTANNLAVYTNAAKYVDFIGVDAQTIQIAGSTITPLTTEVKHSKLNDFIGKIDNFFSCSKYDGWMSSGCWYEGSGLEKRNYQASLCSQASTWDYKHSFLRGTCYCSRCLQ